MPKIRAIHHSVPSPALNGDISTQLTVLQNTMGNIVTAFEDFRIETRTEIGEIKTFYATLAEKFNERRQTNWPTVLAFFTAAATIIMAAFYIISLKTENIVSPVKQELIQVKVLSETSQNLVAKNQEDISKLRADLDTNNARDQVSEKDREKLNEAAVRRDEHLGRLDAEDQVLSAKLVEVETQFKAADQSRNVQFANQLRWDSLLWEKAFGTRFPSEVAFYPNISSDGQMPAQRK